MSRTRIRSHCRSVDILVLRYCSMVRFSNTVVAAAVQSSDDAEFDLLEPPESSHIW